MSQLSSGRSRARQAPPKARSKPTPPSKSKSRRKPRNKSSPGDRCRIDNVSSPRGEADECATLLAALNTVADGRKPRGVRYPLGSVLALCVLGFMCGCENMSQIRRFGLKRKALLKELGFRRGQVPSVSGFSRIVGGVLAGDLARALSQWLSEALGRPPGTAHGIASVDGKASKASGCHIVNVFLHEVQQVIWQAPVDKKANEITAFKQALAALIAAYPFVWLFVGDAMFAGTPLCELLVENGRHYLFQIKADQPTLLEKLKLVFAGFLRTQPGTEAWEGEKKEGVCRRA
jgi:hypothetical protein